LSALAASGPSIESEHRINENEASEVAVDLAYRLVKKAYRLMS